MAGCSLCEKGWFETVECGECPEQHQIFSLITRRVLPCWLAATSTHLYRVLLTGRIAYGIGSKACCATTRLSFTVTRLSAIPGHSSLLQTRNRFPTLSVLINVGYAVIYLRTHLEIISGFDSVFTPISATLDQPAATVAGVRLALPRRHE